MEGKGASWQFGSLGRGDDKMTAIVMPGLDWPARLYAEPAKPCLDASTV